MLQGHADDPIVSVREWPGEFWHGCIGMIELAVRLSATLHVPGH